MSDRAQAVDTGNFDSYADWVLFAEGEYADDEADRGGVTHHGLSRRFLQSINWTGGVPTAEQARAVYRAYFWDGYQCESMHPLVAWCACDAYIQHPTKAAALMIQQGLGVELDGKIGPITLQASQSPNLVLFWRRYRLARVRYYNDIVQNDASQNVFIDGWHDRLHKLTEGMFFAGLIQKDDSGGIKSSLTSKTAKAVTAGLTIGGVVTWLQSGGVDLHSIMAALPEGGLIGLATTWLAKHNFSNSKG